MMDENIISKIYQYVVKRRKTSLHPRAGLRIIERFIERCSSEDFILELRSLKISILREIGELEDLEKEIHLKIKVNPMHPENWFDLIYFYRHDSCDKEKSSHICDVCVSISKIDGNFIIQSLTERCRNFLYFEDPDGAEKDIKSIMFHNNEVGAIDQKPTNDIIKMQNSHLLSQSIISEYRRFIDDQY